VVLSSYYTIFIRISISRSDEDPPVVTGTIKGQASLIALPPATVIEMAVPPGSTIACAGVDVTPPTRVIAAVPKVPLTSINISLTL
jgi:hypothetical protein